MIGSRCRRSEISKTYFLNRYVAVFFTRERSHDNAPTARSMSARGNAPGKCPSSCSALQGRRIPPPFQGALIDSETQGVAQGLRTPALSAPESKLCKSEFTTLAGRPFIRVGFKSVSLDPGSCADNLRKAALSSGTRFPCARLCGNYRAELTWQMP